MRICTPSLDGQFATALVRSHVEADDRGVRGLGELHVVLGDAADAAVHDDELDVVALELAQRLGARFERALHVGLQHDVERRGLAALNLLEEVFETGPARGGDRLLTDEARALGARLGEGARVSQVARDAHLVAGERWLAEARESARASRVRRDLTCLPWSLMSALTLPKAGPATTGSPTSQQTLLDHDGRHRTAAHFEVGLEHGADRAPGGPRGELARSRRRGGPARAARRCPFPAARRSPRTMVSPPHFSGTRPCSESCWSTRSGLASGRSILLIATMIGTLGGLGVVDRLDRLGHDAVVGRHHQDDDVGDLGAARAHGREGLVAGGVEEGDRLARAR